MSGIFISYRRDDTAGYAGRLYDALIAHFDKRFVFIDVDSIRPGEDFVQAIDKSIASSSVVIVLIGKGWLNSGGVNSRRLDDPHDFVRLEVASALRQKIPVIPVLVGGATMPQPGDLPGVLAPLAHINAIEIFDQLFRDSVRHLIDELRPFAPPRPFFQGWTRRGLGALGLFALFLLGSLWFAVVVARHKQTVASNFNQRPGSNEIAPDPSVTMDSVGENAAPPIKITAPPDISELPPVVEASKHVTPPGSSSLVTGPSKPRTLWSANVTVGDAWSVVGIATDGTVYLYDTERSVLDAIRDGKELWAHPSPSPLGFDAEGRFWAKGYSSARSADEYHVFNSRGEGGRVGKKLWPDPAKFQLSTPSLLTTYYSCSDGKVSKYARESRVWIVNTIWTVDLDGNCTNEDPVVAPQTGNVFVWSDTKTLYAIGQRGQVLWSVKQACKDTGYKVYPVLNDDLVVACRHQALYALRGGKPLWTANLGAGGDWFWGDIIADAVGNIYVGGEGPPVTGYVGDNSVVALDKAGKPIWRVSTGTIYGADPIGFDPQGRLYVKVRDSIVALSQ